MLHLALFKAHTAQPSAAVPFSLSPSPSLECKPRGELYSRRSEAGRILAKGERKEGEKIRLPFVSFPWPPSFRLFIQCSTLE